MLRHVVVPVLAPFLLSVTVVLFAAARPVPRPRPRAPYHLGRLLRHIGALATGGYAVFLAVVLVFHVLLVGDRGALRSAAWSGIFLVAVSALVFVVLSWLQSRLRRGSHGGPRC